MSSALAYEGAFPVPNLAGRDIGQYIRVKMDADGQIQAATNGDTDKDVEIGLNCSQIYGSVDEIASVEPLVPGKVYRVIAADTWTHPAVLYRAVNGKVSDTVSGSQFGRSLESAGAANEEVLIVYSPAKG